VVTIDTWVGELMRIHPIFHLHTALPHHQHMIFRTLTMFPSAVECISERVYTGHHDCETSKSADSLRLWPNALPASQGAGVYIRAWHCSGFGSQSFRNMVHPLYSSTASFEYKICMQAAVDGQLMIRQPTDEQPTNPPTNRIPGDVPSFVNG